MNFSSVKAITIPEGKVTQIACGGNVLWKAVTARIPSEYQEVEWIGKDGNSYFVSNFTINALDRFTLYYRYNVPSGTGQAFMFGANNDSSLGDGGVNTPRFMHRYSGLVLNYTKSGGAAYPALVHDGAFHTLELNCVHNGSLKGYKDGVLSINSTFYNAKVFDTFGVFCNNYAKAPQSYIAKNGSKISELRFVDDTTGEDVFNPVPCYRRSDGVIGMYDTVSKNFFTNQGTGSFTKGENVEKAI